MKKLVVMIFMLGVSMATLANELKLDCVVETEGKSNHTVYSFDPELKLFNGVKDGVNGTFINDFKIGRDIEGKSFVEINRADGTYTVKSKRPDSQATSTGSCRLLK